MNVAGLLSKQRTQLCKLSVSFDFYVWIYAFCLIVESGILLNCTVLAKPNIMYIMFASKVKVNNFANQSKWETIIEIDNRSKRS